MAVSAAAAALMVLSGSGFAHADEQAGAGAGQGSQCLTDYYATGSAIVIAETLEVPLENIAGGPYATSGISSAPDSHALGAAQYPGFGGEVILQTSGFWPGNPSAASAYWPPAGGGRTADQQDYGAVAHSTADAQPSKATADARVMATGAAEEGRSGGLSLAHSDSTYDGRAVAGSEVATGYGLTLGPLHVDFLRSEVHWRSDGTDAGAVGTWKLEFHGLRNGSTTVYSASGDGWSFQGGSTQPGDDQRRQFNEQQQKFSQALDDAGIGQAELRIQPGAVTARGDLIQIKGAGLLARLAPKPTRGQTDQAASLQLGRVWQEVRTGLGPCDAVGQLPHFTQAQPPAGPSVPKFPPDKCDREGCHPQSFPPPLPVPGGKRPVAVSRVSMITPTW